MTIPSVTITQVDGALGSQPVGAAQSYLAVIGPADAGAIATPAALGRPRDVVAAFTAGPLVEDAAFWAQRYGRPVIAIRTTTSTPGAAGALVATMTGTSVATVDAGSAPNDDYDVYIVFPTGGTIGVAGITLQWSLDGGRRLSPVTALGVALFFTIPGSGGIKINFAAGTIVAGDSLVVPTTQPIPSAANLAVALTALQANATLPWEFVSFAFPIDAALFDQIETSFAALFAAGKFKGWIGNTRRRNAGESEAAYKVALDAIFGSKTTIFGSLYAGDAKIASAVSGRTYRKRVSQSVGALQASVSEEVNLANIDDGGPVPGTTIVDVNGNPDNHDETVNPGLDDSRFGTLRTWGGRVGCFVTRPRILCPVGSDFSIMPYRRVMNLYLSTLYPYLQRRLNKPVRVRKTTGTILEADALEIERIGLQVLRGALLAKPKASDVQLSVSRTDNLLATKTMTIDGGLVPLAYPEFISFSVAFINPAFQLVTVAA